MSDSVNNVGQNSLTTALNASATSGSTSASATKSTDKIGKDEFLTMLVTQLKNQDPMDPMKSDQFAVNLAQFSQLEQLVAINGKIGGSTTTDMASLAGFLGNQVSVKTDEVHVKDGDGETVSFDLASAAKGGTLEILGTDSRVLGQMDLGAMAIGKQTVALKDLGIADGTYTARVTTVGYDGVSTTADLSVAGTVTGFIPGSDPSLLIGDREVKPADITLVSSAAAAA